MWEPLGDQHQTTNWITLAGFLLVTSIITAKANRAEFEDKLEKEPKRVRELVAEGNSLDKARRMYMGEITAGLGTGQGVTPKPDPVFTGPAATPAKKTLVWPSSFKSPDVDNEPYQPPQ